MQARSKQDTIMMKSRRGNVLWKVGRKVFALVALVIGVRLIYTSVAGGSTKAALHQEETKSGRLNLTFAYNNLEETNGLLHGVKESASQHFKHTEELADNKVSVVYFAQDSELNMENLDVDTPDIHKTHSSNSAKKTESRITAKVTEASPERSELNGPDNEHNNNAANIPVPHATLTTMTTVPVKKTTVNKNTEIVIHSENDAETEIMLNTLKTENLSNSQLNYAHSIEKEMAKNDGSKAGASIRLSEKQIQSNATHRQVKEVPIEEARSYGVCKKLIPWRQKYHAQFSTYDIPKKANYTTDDAGQYSIPVRSAQEVTNTENIEPVTVILVPFSHADPGYGRTIEEYYAEKTHSTLNNMVNKLRQYPDMTFQWAETVFLARWFDDLNEENKQQVKELIKRGQFEIVLGGWVMPDEASTHYVSVVDQLIEGHQWLIENLGVKPKNAWVNDPFGYSSTMPYLWKESGMDNMVFLRIDQAVKAQMMEMKSLEFNWRPYWKYTNSSDMLASLMAYTNYWLADVCGPDPKICKEFVFIKSDNSQDKANALITEDNLEVKAKTLYEQYRRTVDLYKYNTLYIGLGEDFSFSKASEWDALYTNYKQLINYINSKEEWKMKIKFGTLTDYFNNLRKEERRKSETAELSRKQEAEFPTLSGDFFPYTEKKNEYWTGYYSTRPLNKQFSRELEPLVRAADIFNVMVFSFFKYYNIKYSGYSDVAKNLRTARRELGMFLHHDGITGTSLPHVVRDYEKRLLKAHDNVQAAFKSVLMTLLTRGSKHQSNLLLEETVKPGPRQMSQKIVFDVTKENQLVLINSLSKKRKEIISIYINSRNCVIDSPKTSNVPFQITISNETGKLPQLMATFPVELPSFGIEVFKIRPVSESNNKNTVYESTLETESKNNVAAITIANHFMKVEFDKTTGMLSRIIDGDGRVTNVSAEFLVYQSKRSGAYIFGPAGPAQAFSTGKRVVTVTKGYLMSEVKVIYPGFHHSVKLYNTTTIQGQGVHIRNVIDMAAVGMLNMEVILRFKTDVKNGHNFFTDQNGYQIMGRETMPEKKIESNYYPITTMTLLEDKDKRLTLHCKQPHGAASLKEGELEVMLDRHTFRDDGRGLGQGVYDNVKVSSDFVIQTEYKTVPKEIDELRYTYPTQDSVLINDMLQNKIQMYHVTDNSVKIVNKVHPLKTAEIPCDISVVGLRNLVKNNLDYNGTSLILHRNSLQCGYQSMNKQCTNDTDKLTIRSLLPKLKVDIFETSLSHLHEKRKLDMDSDIKPEHMELRAFTIRV